MLRSRRCGQTRRKIYKPKLYHVATEPSGRPRKFKSFLSMSSMLITCQVWTGSSVVEQMLAKGRVPPGP